MNEIIKKYEKNLLNLEETILQLDKNNYSEEEIKKGGIFYTPQYITEYIINNLKPSLNETILEPSVGHGIFIFTLIEYMKKKYDLSNSKLKKWFINKVFCYDIEKKNIKEFKELLIIFFSKQNIEITLNDLINIEIKNTLRFNPKSKFDIIFGNPPYIRIKNIDKDELNFLRENYNSCKKGNIDIYYAFIEYSIKYGKRSSFITPNSWLYNKSAKNIRKQIKNNLIKIIDFKEKKIFKNVGTYTSIFLYNENLFEQELIYSEDINIENKKIIKNNLDDDRWNFFDYDFNNNIKILKYHTPIATLRDKIYINNQLESKDLIPFYKISKIKSEKDFHDSKQSIIFPYENINNKWTILDENKLDTKTLIYLNENKEELNKRDKGKVDKYDSWFAYGRRQGLNFYSKDTYLIIIPGMIANKFNFFKINTNDIPKPFLFSSGFFLEVDEENVDKLLNYLNSPIFKEYLKNNAKIWKGKDIKNPYFSISITQLKKIFEHK
jgi:adenine-specific DNA-methyltransferase